MRNLNVAKCSFRFSNHDIPTVPTRNNDMKNRSLEYQTGGF